MSDLFFFFPGACPWRELLVQNCLSVQYLSYDAGLTVPMLTS